MVLWTMLMEEEELALPGILKDAQEKYYPVSSRHLYRWLAHYVKFGEVPEQTKRWRKETKPKKRKRGELDRTDGENVWGENDTTMLKEIVDEHPALYLDEIQEHLFQRTGRNWSTSYIWKKLKDEVGYSLQVATKQAIDRDEELRDEYLESVEEAVMYLDQLVYIDETQKSRNDARRRRYWSQMGVTPVAPDPFHGFRDERYSLLAAADINGFIQSACEVVHRERGDNDRNPTRGTIDQARFELWVEHFLCPVLGNYDEFEPRSVVVLDNASIHHSDRVVDLIESTGARIIYTAPYSPDLNPIELMFNVYKMSLRRNGMMEPAIAEQVALCSVTPATARNCFRKSRVPGSELLPRDGEEELEAVVAAVAIAAALATIDKLEVYIFD